MKIEEIQNNSYPFYFIGGKNNSFAFVTELKISYEIKLKESNYLFEEKLKFPISAYEFVIEVANNPTYSNPILDKKIPYTIASIFYDFFTSNPNLVIIYICDSSDSRQEARRRKFNSWTEMFKGNLFVKFDSKIEDPNGIIYYNSIIIRNDNQFRIEIIEAFLALADDNQK